MFSIHFRKNVTLPARETRLHNVDKSQKGAPEYEVKLKEVSSMLQNSCFSLGILVSHWLVSVSLAACHIFLGGLLALLCRLVFASWAACWRLLGGLSALPGRLVGCPGRLVGAACMGGLSVFVGGLSALPGRLVGCPGWLVAASWTACRRSWAAYRRFLGCLSAVLGGLSELKAERPPKCNSR